MEIIKLEHQKADEIFQGVEKVANFLEELPPEAGFDMEFTFSEADKMGMIERSSKEVVRVLASGDYSCGCTACVSGWADVAVSLGIINFNPFSKLMDLDEVRAWTFNCSEKWASHPTENTRAAAIARLRFFVKHKGIPGNWRGQMMNKIKSTYYETNH